MISVPATGLNLSEAQHLVPLIEKILERWTSYWDIDIEIYNGIPLWNIDIPGISKNLRNFLIMEISPIYQYANYHLVGSDPIIEYILNNKGIVPVFFSGLILVKQPIDLTYERTKLMGEGYGYLKNYSIDYVKGFGEIIFIGKSGLVIKGDKGGNLEAPYQTTLRELWKS